MGMFKVIILVDFKGHVYRFKKIYIIKINTGEELALEPFLCTKTIKNIIVLTAWVVFFTAGRAEIQPQSITEPPPC